MAETTNASSVDSVGTLTRALREDLLEYMRERFNHVDGKLDSVSCTQRAHGERIVAIETTCKERNVTSGQGCPSPGLQNGGYTRRQQAVIGGGLVGSGALLLKLAELAEKIIGAAQHAVK